jgi:hypothetical protein
VRRSAGAAKPKSGPRGFEAGRCEPMRRWGSSDPRTHAPPPCSLARLPGARTAQVPAGCVLTSDEIIALVVAADERKRRGESWITAEDAGPEGFTVRVPKSAAITQPEAIVVLSPVKLRSCPLDTETRVSALRGMEHPMQTRWLQPIDGFTDGSFRRNKR